MADPCLPMRSYLSGMAASWLWIRVDQWEATCLGWQSADGGSVLTNQKQLFWDGSQLMADPCWLMKSYLSGMQPADGGSVLTNQKLLVWDGSQLMRSVSTHEKLLVWDGSQLMADPCWPMRSYLSGKGGFVLTNRSILIVDSWWPTRSNITCNMPGMEESCWPMRSIVTCLGFCVVERSVGIVSHV
jgi:hypothetical protein